MRGRRKAIAVVAAGALVVAGAAGAAQTGLLTISVGAGKHAAATGVQVHGKWSLVVRGRSGKVVARRHFENALTTSGAALLIGTIAPATNVGAIAGLIGGVQVVLDDGSTVGHGCNLLFNVNSCAMSRIWTRGTDSSGQYGTGNLKVASSSTSVTLSGTITPLVAVTITKVETLLKGCDSWLGYDTEDCANQTPTPGEAAWTQFTAKTLGAALNVQAGQNVAVTVQLSFS